MNVENSISDTKLSDLNSGLFVSQDAFEVKDMTGIEGVATQSCLKDLQNIFAVSFVAKLVDALVTIPGEPGCYTYRKCTYADGGTIWGTPHY